MPYKDKQLKLEKDRERWRKKHGKGTRDTANTVKQIAEYSRNHNKGKGTNPYGKSLEDPRDTSQDAPPEDRVSCKHGFWPACDACIIDVWVDPTGGCTEEN